MEEKEKERREEQKKQRKGKIKILEKKWRNMPKD